MAARSSTPPKTEVQRIPLARIQPSHRNPRRRLRRLDELAESMRVHGLLQPVVVRPLRGGKYEVIAGHRRLAAAQSLEWSDVPAIVRTSTEDHAYLLTLVENLQRDDLSPKEEAGALQALIRERNWTATQVANSIQKSIAYVSRRVRVFEDPILAPFVLQELLTVSVAEELLPLPERTKRALAERAVEHDWERKEVRAEIAKAERGARARGLNVARKASDLRRALQGLWPGHLSDVDRRELRLLFSYLAVLAKAPATQEQIIPALPELNVASRQGRRRRS